MDFLCRGVDKKIFQNTEKSFDLQRNNLISKKDISKNHMIIIHELSINSTIK